MSKRIINIHDGPNNAPDPKQPATMQDVLNSAQAAWKAGEKEKAFILALGGIAMCSQGTAVAMKQSEAAMAEVLKLKAVPPKE